MPTIAWMAFWADSEHIKKTNNWYSINLNINLHIYTYLNIMGFWGFGVNSNWWGPRSVATCLKNCSADSVPNQISSDTSGTIVSRLNTTRSLPVQCNFTCRLSTWWTRIFWRKCWLKIRPCCDLIKSPESACLYTMNFLLAISGRWCRTTKSSCCTSQRRWLKIDCRNVNTCSTFWTRFSQRICRLLSSMRTISAILCRTMP